MASRSWSVVECAACQDRVDPGPGGVGACPVCGRGRVASMQWTVPEPSLAKGAAGALVTGIVSFLFAPLALLLAPFAFVMGARANRRVRAAQGQLTGSGMATTGMVLAGVGVAFAVVLAAVAVAGFFFIVALADEPDLEGTVTLTQASWTDGFRLDRPSHVHFMFEADQDAHGGIVRTGGPDDPQPVGNETWGEGFGRVHAGGAHLLPGDYGIWVECGRSPCTISYALWVDAEPRGVEEPAGTLVVEPQQTEYIVFEVPRTSSVSVDASSDRNETSVSVYLYDQSLWLAAGTSTATVLELERGTYHLAVLCFADEACTVTYQIETA